MADEYARFSPNDLIQAEKDVVVVREGTHKDDLRSDKMWSLITTPGEPRTGDRYMDQTTCFQGVSNYPREDWIEQMVRSCLSK